MKWDEGLTLFYGHHKHTIDEKGRLSIPARFRDALKGDPKAPLFLTCLKNYLVAYPAAEWAELERQLNSKPRFDPAVQRFRRSVYSLAKDLTIDSAGRILIPQELRDRAGLQRDVTLAGMGNTFEIWNSDQLAQAVENDQENMEEILRDIGDIGI